MLCSHTHKINKYFKIIKYDVNRPLDCVIGFNENSHVLPFLHINTNQFYLNNKKTIMINLAPPQYFK